MIIKKKLSSGEIAGIVIGSIVGLVVLYGIGGWVMQKYGKKTGGRGYRGSAPRYPSGLGLNRW